MQLFGIDSEGCVQVSRVGHRRIVGSAPVPSSHLWKLRSAANPDYQRRKSPRDLEHNQLRQDERSESGLPAGRCGETFEYVGDHGAFAGLD